MAVKHPTYPAESMAEVLLKRAAREPASMRFSDLEEDALWTLARATNSRPGMAAVILEGGLKVRDERLVTLLCALCAETGHAGLTKALFDQGHEAVLERAIDFMAVGAPRIQRAEALAITLAACRARRAAQQSLSAVAGVSP
jgi:hypothetical protein